MVLNEIEEGRNAFISQLHRHDNGAGSLILNTGIDPDWGGGQTETVKNRYLLFSDRPVCFILHFKS